MRTLVPRSSSFLRGRVSPRPFATAAWALACALLPSALLAQVPGAPTLVSPSGSVLTGMPTYTWNAVSGATEYQLYVYRNTVVLVNVWLPAASVCSGSTCSHTPATALTPHDYVWKVRARNASGTGVWSSIMAFNAAPTNWTGNTCASFALGDFNGDGRTDRLCRISGVMNVSLATAEGFTSLISLPASWVYAAVGSVPHIADVNQDGKQDLVFYNSFDGRIYVAKSLGNRFEDVVLWGTANIPGYTCRLDPYVAGTGDFNGDGLVDVFCKLTTSGRIFVGLHNGSNGFNFSLFATYTCNTTEQRVGVVDLNADGKDDWYCIGGGKFYGLLSNGTSFQTGTFTTFGPYCTLPDWQVGDLNGDGLPDAACAANGNLAFGTGNAILNYGTFAESPCTPSRTFPADLDGDGKAELVCNKNGANADDIQVRRWDGSTLTAPVIWKASWCPGKVYPGDFNADGKTDLLCETDQSVIVAGTNGVRADQMVEATNGLGGSVKVTYAASTTMPDAHIPSASFPGTNNPGVRHLATSIELQDGKGGPSVSTFSYAGGRIDHKEKQFLGYAYVRATAPCIDTEAPCPYRDTWFSQNVPSAGSPTASERRDGAGALLQRSTSTYTDSAAGTLPRRSLLARSDQFSYSGGSSRQTYSTFTYDAYGNRLQEISQGDAASSGDELHTTSIYAYNTSAYIVNRPGQIERRATVGGTVLAAQEFLYDGAGSYTVAPTKGNLTTQRALKAQGGSYVSRTYTYDAKGNPTGGQDETSRSLGATTFDATDQLFPVSHQNAAGETVSTAWDKACGVPTQVTDANGQVTTAQYDSLCRLTRTDLPPAVGGFEIRQYLDLGNPGLQRTRVETPPATGSSGNDWAETSFDGLGRTYRTEKRGPSSSQTIVTETTYNERGGVRESTPPYYENATPPVPTKYEYDALDRPTRVEHADGHDAETAYGLWQSTVTDENGRSAIRRYDAHGRVVEEERSLSGQPVVTTSAYDTLGRLLGLEDAVGNTWSWTYDALGRMTARNDPDAGAWSYTYDDAGRPLTQVDAKNQTTSFTYDALMGRQATKVSPVGTTTFTYSQARAGFFNVGRVTTIAAPGVAHLVDHDAIGRAVKQTRTVDGGNYVFQKRFDSSGRVTGITYPDDDEVGPVGSPILYDQAGRLRSVPGIVNDVQYDAAGRPIQRTNANGTATAMGFDPDRGFLESIYTSGPAVVQDLTYGIDPAGLVNQVTSPSTNDAWSYAYDDLYRLVTATNLNTPANSQSWTYDAIGRITYNSRVGTYTYPTVGQPRPHAPTNVAGAGYTYDPNGNLAAGAGRTPAWDAENRITQVGTSQFSYDGSGERVKKVASGVTSVYPLGDDYEITNGTVTKYISVDGLGVVAKRVGAMPSPVTYWLHTDRLGNIQAITDATGAIVQRRTYRPYGEKVADTTGHVESRGWIDQRQDETGLTYLHARYYDPQLGTFLSPDPIGPEGGLNSYGYGFGDPANLADRSGLDPQPGGCYYTGGATFQCFSPGSGNQSPGGFNAQVSGDVIPTLKGIWNWLSGLFSVDPGGASSQGAGPVGDEAEFAGRPERIPHGPTGTPTTGGVTVPPPVVTPDAPPPPPPCWRCGGGGELSPQAQQVIAGVDQYNLQSNFFKMAGTTVAVGTGLGTFELAGGLGVAQITTLGAGGSLVPPATKLLYSAHQLARAGSEVTRIGRPGPFHNFPYSFDGIILRDGMVRSSGRYIEYGVRGAINADAGVYELGGFWSSGAFRVTHRFFETRPGAWP